MIICLNTVSKNLLLFTAQWKAPQRQRTRQTGNMTDDAVSTLGDRSILSDEMASLCAKLPIYCIKRTTTQRKSLAQN